MTFYDEVLYMRNDDDIDDFAETGYSDASEDEYDEERRRSHNYRYWGGRRRRKPAGVAEWAAWVQAAKVAAEKKATEEASGSRSGEEIVRRSKKEISSEAWRSFG